MIKLRIATPDDGAALAEIYRYYVTDTTITFEYEPPSGEEFSARIADKLTKYPYLVAEEDGVPVGYAYASYFRERAAYGWDAELSVYVGREKRHSGVGGRLYSALIEILKLQNFINLYAWITTPNPASFAFHEKIGFEQFCVIPAVGYKHGEWHDVAWYQLRIANSGTPKEIIPFPALNGEKVRNILENH